jgi:allantoin racemase
MRLADNLGYGALLKHIETVTPSGAALQSDAAMAHRVLSAACARAAQFDVKCIILGGAGLAGYAQKLQESIPVPLIDSTLAGLALMLQNKAPAASQTSDGFYAAWNNMPDAFARRDTSSQCVSAVL